MEPPVDAVPFYWTQGKDAAHRPDFKSESRRRLARSLHEMIMAIRLLGEGKTGNAAGKAYNAWRELLGALVNAFSQDALKRLEDEPSRNYFIEKLATRVPSSRLSYIAGLLVDLGLPPLLLHLTHVALNLHDFEYNGPDEEGVVSKFASDTEAKKSLIALAFDYVRLLEGLKPELAGRGIWSDSVERLYEELRSMLGEASEKSR